MGQVILPFAVQPTRFLYARKSLIVYVKVAFRLKNDFEATSKQFILCAHNSC